METTAAKLLAMFRPEIKPVEDKTKNHVITATIWATSQTHLKEIRFNFLNLSDSEVEYYLITKLIRIYAIEFAENAITHQIIGLFNSSMVEYIKKKCADDHIKIKWLHFDK